MTAEQLEAARAERMRQNGHGAITIEDVRTWIEETGLCIFLPRSAQAGFTAPTFVEAVAGQRTTEPTLDLIASAESLLVRLEADGVAVRLNLAGQPGDQPDYVVAGWVLPYIYALRGDRDWRRSPQLTGSRQVSQLAVSAAKQLESANLTAAEIRDALGRETTETAVLRALHELWKQLRVIPVVPEVGSPALWQPLRQRFQKAIAEGASTSQVTAISVLASIYLQAVIAASMEDVEMFLSPLTSRSKIREVVRGLAATRQVHSTNMGHSPMYYVAGTLPEFPAVPSFQIGSSLSNYRSSGYRSSSYLSSYNQAGLDEPLAEAEVETVAEVTASAPIEIEALPAAPVAAPRVEHAAPPRRKAPSAPAAGKSSAPRPRTGKSAVHGRERGRSASGAGESRSNANGDRRRAPAPRSASSHTSSHASSSNGNGHSKNGHSANGSNGNRFAKPSGPVRNGARPSQGSGQGEAAKSARPAWSTRSGNNGHTTGAKPVNGARPKTAGTGNGRSNGNGVKNGAGKNAVNGVLKAGSTARPFAKAAPKSTTKSASKPAARPRPTADGPKRNGMATSASKRMSFAGQAKQAPKSATQRTVAGKAVAKPAAKSGVAARSSRPAATKRRG